MNHYQDLTALRMQHREEYLTRAELANRWRISASTASRLMRCMRVWRPRRTLVRIPMSEVERVEREHMR